MQCQSFRGILLYDEKSGNDGVWSNMRDLVKYRDMSHTAATINLSSTCSVYLDMDNSVSFSNITSFGNHLDLG